MGVDQTSLDRIRNATFPTARRGYDKHEVEKFLARLADWLETGGGDESRSDTVKRELERVGQRTGAILAQAEESAQQIRAEAEEEARATIENVGADVEKARAEVDEYASRTRTEADQYAEKARGAVEEEASGLRDEAETEARETIDSAQAQARRIVEEGKQRREDIEAVIADLVRRRDEVLADTDDLVAKLVGAIGEHRPEDGDPFDTPEELDPLERDSEDVLESDSAPDEESAEADEEDQEEPASAEADTEEKKPRRKPQRKREVKA
jgi:DivIVA domain-containing protein